MVTSSGWRWETAQLRPGQVQSNGSIKMTHNLRPAHGNLLSTVGGKESHRGQVCAVTQTGACNLRGQMASPQMSDASALRRDKTRCPPSHPAQNSTSSQDENKARLAGNRSLRVSVSVLLCV